MKHPATGILLAASVLLAILTASCGDEVKERIPNWTTYINLSDAGLWQTYGVSAFGESRDFIRSQGVPSGFHYTANTFTGYGGVMLIYGQNPYTTAIEPLAFDLSCPVERSPDVRVYIGKDWEAICPVCGSHYNVIERGGVAISGEAAELGRNYKLRMYAVLPAAVTGSISATGYIITNTY